MAAKNIFAGTGIKTTFVNFLYGDLKKASSELIKALELACPGCIPLYLPAIRAGTLHTDLPSSVP